MIKHLIVSGCSFTHEPHNEWYPFAWPSILADRMAWTVENLAVPGAGNDHISRSMILHLEHTKPNIENTLVLIMWSGVGRIDWIADRELSNFGSKYPFHYQYDEYNELVLGGNWWNKKNPNHLIATLQEYSKYQSDYSFSLTSWLAMKNLSNYLKSNGYRYLYTSFLCYNNPNNIKGEALVVPFFDILKKLGLELDQSDWMNLVENDHYGDWARENDALDLGDNFHPRFPEANEGWVDQILIPYLKTQGI